MNMLNQPVGYTPDSDEFKEWLEEGVEEFNKE
jgi:thiol:disulfide interchange protein DsbD